MRIARQVQRAQEDPAAMERMLAIRAKTREIEQLAEATRP